MTTLSLIFTLLFYVALIIFIVGMARKIYQFYITPAPLKIPVAPTPLTKGGVVMRLTREVVLFESLFKSNKWIWLFGFLFHFGLLLVLIRHLRYIWPGDVPELLALTQPFKYAAFAMLVGLAGLLFRRIAVARIRYISAPSDYLMLIMLIVIGVSGAVMTFTNNHIDIAMAKNFATGLVVFDWSNMPNQIHFIVHFLLFLVLLMVFPISKLLHVPGVFFSPTRNQVDDARTKRHISPWALKEEKENAVKLGETIGTDNQTDTETKGDK
jgi:nitrate reductase gamma subunit